MCTSWDIRYFISTSGSRPPSLIFHSPWRRPVLKFVPLRCLMQKICGFRWSFTYNRFLMSGLSASGFLSTILISGWTHIELCTGRCCYQQRWLRHPQKQMQQRWSCFQTWFTPFDSMVTKFVEFSLKNHPHRLHFWWHNSKTVGLFRNSQRHSIRLWWLYEYAKARRKITTGNWDIQEKLTGCNFAPPLLSCKLLAVVCVPCSPTFVKFMLW